MNSPEINALVQALNLTPENLQLKKIVLSKMMETTGYSESIIKYAKELNQEEPNNLEYTEILIQEYYKLENYSACMVIIENIQDPSQLSANGRASVAKVYLKSNEVDEARSVYTDLIAAYPDFVDDELDDQFRVKETVQELEVTDDQYFLKKPEATFDDVGGMAKVKKEIEMKIIKPLENQKLFASYGKKVGGGILMFGPPGCGKTFMAKATAGQIKANFINIGLNDILDMWIGNSEKNLHNYFEMARRNTPCVLFFDEIDALGGKRSDMKFSGNKNIINQFLSELDGIDSNNEGILIMGASNCPWDIDPAFRRPGRFDRIIFVPPPDQESREVIFELKMKEKPHENINYKSIASLTKDYSGADIDAVIDIAVEKVLEEAMETGNPRPLNSTDLQKAIKLHSPSTMEWFTTAKNYAVFANKSGLYDDILKYLKI